jgi:hypothetical protein
VKVNYSARGVGQKLVKVMISKKKKRGTTHTHTEYRVTEEINDGRVQAHK